MNHTIRPANPADASAIAHIRVVTWQHTYRDILSTGYLAGLSEQEIAGWMVDTIQRGGAGKFALIAEDEHNQPAGYALGGPERDGDPFYTGEIYAIYVLPQFHRRGIGRDLFIEAARHLWRQQFSAMLLWVLTDNLPSRSFYEAMGGKVINQDVSEFADGRYAITAYGWNDVTTIFHNQ